MPESAYDIIPDIHGDLDRLEAPLRTLGYAERAGAWRAPPGRRAAFLGDFIDGGSKNLAVIAVVRAMREADQAVAIMGNHELNAWLYHTPGRNPHEAGHRHMRAHVPKNRRQHETFLAEAPVGSPEARDALSFIASLPVFLDLGGLRLAHAAWSEAAVMAIRARRPDGLLSKADLQRLALEDESDPFTAAVLAMVKGPEATLPPGYAFHDHKGERRTEIRLRWWAAEAATWRDVAASVPDLSELPDGPFDDAAAPDPGPVPVAFGHHKRSGPVEIDAARALCLDYPETPIAYRWDGETAFDPSRLVFA